MMSHCFQLDRSRLHLTRLTSLLEGIFTYKKRGAVSTGVECEQAYDDLFNVIGKDQVDPTNIIDPSKSNGLISDNFTPLL